MEDARVSVWFAVRSRQGTIHMSSMFTDQPEKKRTFANTVDCSQRISGTIIAQSTVCKDVFDLVTCERCRPSLRKLDA